VFERPLEGEVFYTTRLNEAEIMVGLHYSGNEPARRTRLKGILDTLVILELTAAASEQFGIIKAFLTSRGEIIGDFDTLIAAIALCNDQPMLTRNVKHFSRVPGLKVEAY
jgi:predicted nucleic acid-binding protein